jgi:hypothetical protein
MRNIFIFQVKLGLYGGCTGKEAYMPRNKDYIPAKDAEFDDWFKRLTRAAVIVPV